MQGERDFLPAVGWLHVGGKQAAGGPGTAQDQQPALLSLCTCVLPSTMELVKKKNALFSFSLFLDLRDEYSCPVGGWSFFTA